jgi:hypothetical protein
MSDFGDLMGEINNGLSGKNQGLSMGFHRLNRYVGIRKRIYTFVFGPTGSGKSAFVHSAFILNPFEDYIRGGRKGKFKVILFSQERSKIYIFAKWLSRKIFVDNGILIQVPKMLGWWDEKLSLEEQNLVKLYEDYFNELMEVVDVVQGAQNPTGIYKYIKNYAEKPENGIVEKVSEFHNVYIPNHPNEIVIPIIDTFGNTKLEKGMLTKKDAVDKDSEYFQWFRDFLGYSPVGISQITRGLNNPLYSKLDSFEPTIDDSKESGRPAEDADLVLSVFDPNRYSTDDPSYRVENFLDRESGANYFRKIKVLKNTYGEDSIGCGMAFQGATGIFKELPRASLMENFDYTKLFSGEYFLKNN